MMMVVRFTVKEFDRIRANKKALGLSLKPSLEVCTDYHVFYKALTALGIEKPVQEYHFHKARRWRFDFCFVKSKLALEVEGGIWTNGRHTRGSGFLKDMEKYNQAVIMGFSLLRVTPEQIDNGTALGLVEQYFKKSK